MKQHPRVAAHRARDVAEHDDGGGLSEPPPVGEQDLAGAETEAPPECGPHVDERAARMRAVAPGRRRRHGETQPCDGRLRRGQLRGRHLLEVPGPQHLPVRPGKSGVELDFFLRLPCPRLAFGPREQCFAQPPAERRRLAARGGVDGGEEEARDPFEKPRVAPEDVERFVEQRPLLGPPDEDRVQRPVEVVAPGEAHRLDRAQRIENGAASYREARCPQGACEMHEVGGEAARGLGPGFVSGGDALRDAGPRRRMAGGFRRRPQPAARA